MESTFIGARKKVTLELARKALLSEPCSRTTNLPVIKSAQTALNFIARRSNEDSECSGALNAKMFK
jgi:hypothetical protein